MEVTLNRDDLLTTKQARELANRLLMAVNEDYKRSESIFLRAVRSGKIKSLQTDEGFIAYYYKPEWVHAYVADVLDAKTKVKGTIIPTKRVGVVEDRKPKSRFWQWGVKGE